LNRDGAIDFLFPTPQSNVPTANSTLTAVDIANKVVLGQLSTTIAGQTRLGGLVLAPNPPNIQATIKTVSTSVVTMGSITLGNQSYTLGLLSQLPTLTVAGHFSLFGTNEYLLSISSPTPPQLLTLLLRIQEMLILW